MKDIIRGLGLVLPLLWAGVAHAGIEECENLRIDASANCNIQFNAGCEASCEELGIYEKSCATKLYRTCRQECTLSADVTCTDSCTGVCEQRCDAGENITCTHNCFGECSGQCELKCHDQADPSQCVATCEANCDGECDIKCKPLIDAGCYKHCQECCGGSCVAQANFDCQEVCQEQRFEECEYEFRANCEASCDAEGALFCDGQYALSGGNLSACVNALVSQGVEISGSAQVDIGGSIGIPPVGSGGSIGIPAVGSGGQPTTIPPQGQSPPRAIATCSQRPGLPGPGTAGVTAFAGLSLIWALRRRKHARQGRTG